MRCKGYNRRRHHRALTVAMVEAVQEQELMDCEITELMRQQQMDCLEDDWWDEQFAARERLKEENRWIDDVDDFNELLEDYTDLPDSTWSD